MYGLYPTNTIYPNQLNHVDREILLSILRTGKYEVGLTLILGDTYDQMETYDAHEVVFDIYTTPGPMNIAYIGYQQKIGKDGVNIDEILGTSIDDNYPLNDVNNVKLIASMKEVKHVYRLRGNVCDDDYLLVTGKYQYLQSVMIVRKIK